MSRIQQLASEGVEIGSLTIPTWALWVLALGVLLLIVGIVVLVLARRARKIARATKGASKGDGEGFGGHGFGYFGAVTSAISITPDVKRNSRRNDGSKSDDRDV
ncbi:hypothetical protein SAMN04489751_3841 [Brevibacterium sandarakinum]|uniref:Uncharacterized protein n=1 Tax=Brevibacterium sandarakinum TaxID=629680 RepID=A0A1H1XTJ1_BRESA|nr:hypothetical protein [Brevibacterium sandarakinum]SDT12537.1 hypothetical protein SAMN04489751_3841 [Brevibacterium sandarakinum]